MLGDVCVIVVVVVLFVVVVVYDGVERIGDARRVRERQGKMADAVVRVRAGLSRGFCTEMCRERGDGVKHVHGFVFWVGEY
jgi:hypothetical protein